MNGRAADNLGVGVFGGECYLPANFAWPKIIIRIKILQPSTACEFEQAVPCCVGAPIWSCLPADFGIEAADQIEAAISRTIVHNDHFRGHAGLGQCAFDRLRNELLGIETGNEN